MNQTEKALCYDCAELYRAGGFYIIRKTDGTKRAKCTACGKTRPVEGVLTGVNRKGDSQCLTN